MPAPWALPIGFMIHVPPLRLNSSTNMRYSLGTTKVWGKKLYCAASAYRSWGSIGAGQAYIFSSMGAGLTTTFMGADQTVAFMSAGQTVAFMSAGQTVAFMSAGQQVAFMGAGQTVAFMHAGQITL
eukprot:1156241-Pelagomonas_calceolata.AAC.5